LVIVSATNDHYAQHLAVMLTSLLKNRKKERPIHFFILYGELSTNSIAKLKRTVGRFNAQITFLKVDVKLFENFALSSGGQKYISREAYYRILIPELLGEEITKTLYLDCDLIVRADISKLWNINIDNYDLAAVDESRVLSKQDRQIRMDRLSLPSKSYYFNSGVLLMNLKRWREKNISSEVIQFITENPEKLGLLDQDALNAVLNNRWLRLKDKWNYTTDHTKKLSLEKAKIIHFTGPYKPWNSNSSFKKEYLKYLKTSRWEKEL
jgi:lipopolysaccharide biosynthesis glycosyltransferase